MQNISTNAHHSLEDKERTLDSPTDKLLMSVSGFASEVERETARQRTADDVTTDGETRRFQAGDVVRVEDIAPCKGHIAVWGGPALRKPLSVFITEAFCPLAGTFCPEHWATTHRKHLFTVGSRYRHCLCTFSPYGATHR